MKPDERVAALYVERRMDVYRYLVTLGVPLVEAQEITQDSFLRLYETLLAGCVVENARAWLFQVAHNLAVNSMKAAEYANRRTMPMDLQDSVPIVERRLIEEERYQRMQEALENLSDQQRACLALRVEGLRYKEIGEVLGVSTSTVSEFLRRAIARLRNALNEQR